MAAANEPLQGPQESNEATRLLLRIREGDVAAVDQLLPLVYEQLRRIAGGYFRDQPADHTLQPTALVHEVFLKMIHRSEASWNNRNHFLAVAAQAMRQILTDHARGKRRDKRGGKGGERVPLERLATPSGESELDILQLENALNQLAEVDSRQAKIIELWFFAGLTAEETASVLDVSDRTIRREWRHARAWLNQAMSSEQA